MLRRCALLFAALLGGGGCDHCEILVHSSTELVGGVVQVAEVTAPIEPDIWASTLRRSDVLSLNVTFDSAGEEYGLWLSIDVTSPLEPGVKPLLPESYLLRREASPPSTRSSVTGSLDVDHVDEQCDTDDAGATICAMDLTATIRVAGMLDTQPVVIDVGLARDEWLEEHCSTCPYIDGCGNEP